MIDSSLSNAGFLAYRTPTKYNWEEKRPELEQLLAKGYGLHRLGKHFNMTSVGMLGVLRRMKLATKEQLRLQRERSKAAPAA